MNTHHPIPRSFVRHALIAPWLVVAPLAFAATEPAGGAGHPPPPDAIAEAFTKGRVTLNIRARYENVGQTGIADANAVTWRTRLGYTTAPLHGFKLMLEAENTAALDGDGYNQAGLNPGGAGRAVVADPEGSELNQAWVSYAHDQTTFTAGRQRLVWDNARFVGDVAWRQNAQTFDALVVQDRSFDRLTLAYGYVAQINRVFGDRHAQGDWDSDSHLFNASHSGMPFGTLTGYGYLLDFANAAAQSCATFGVALNGAPTIAERARLPWRAEFARQTNHGSSPLDYTANYLHVEIGLAVDAVTVGLGYEKLGTDNGASFRTPLATLHAFNGWADAFLTTPAAGLRDTCAKIAVTLPHNLALLAFFHDFATYTGADLGTEFDVQLTGKLTRYVSGALKFASFRRDSPAVPDVAKLWAQLEFVF